MALRDCVMGIAGPWFLIATGVRPEDCKQKQAKSRFGYLLLRIEYMLG